jgi:hypothetical protein
LAHSLRRFSESLSPLGQFLETDGDRLPKHYLSAFYIVKGLCALADYEYDEAWRHVSESNFYWSKCVFGGCISLIFEAFSFHLHLHFEALWAFFLLLLKKPLWTVLRLFKRGFKSTGDFDFRLELAGSRCDHNPRTLAMELSVFRYIWSWNGEFLNHCFFFFFSRAHFFFSTKNT